jgi:hypothetical protein
VQYLRGRPIGCTGSSASHPAQFQLPSNFLAFTFSRGGLAGTVHWLEVVHDPRFRLIVMRGNDLPLSFARLLEW